MSRPAPAVIEPLPSQEATLPHNQEAEESLVGGALFDGRVFKPIAAIVKGPDFYHPALQAIFEAMFELDRQSQPIDIITVAEQMRRSNTIGKLRAYNGEAYLAELANKIATVENIDYHANLVRCAALRRALLDKATALVAQLMRGGDGGDLPKELQELRHQEQEVGRPPLPLPIPSQRIAQLCAEPAAPPIPVGIDSVDRELQGGLLLGRPTVLIAKTGRGKTSFKVQVNLHWLSLGYDVLDLQTELPEVEAYARYLAQMQTAPWRAVLGQRGSPAAAQRLADLAARHLDQHLTLMEFDGSRTLEEVVNEYRARRGRTPLITVDVVQDLATFQIRLSGNRSDGRAAMREISHQCKTLARKLNTICFLVSHTSRAFAARAGKPGRPLSPSEYEGAGRDSADLEQDAGCVLYLDTQDSNADGSAHCDLHIAKQQGARATVPLRYWGAVGRFEPGVRRELNESRKVHEAILAYLDSTITGVSGTALKKALRKRGLGKKETEMNALIFAMSESREIIEREIHANLTLYYHPSHAPKGEQIELPQEKKQ